MPLDTWPGLLSTCVHKMTKYGLGWFLWVYRKVLDHLSQKIFSSLVSESFHPKPLCPVTLLRQKWSEVQTQLDIGMTGGAGRATLQLLVLSRRSVRSVLTPIAENSLYKIRDSAKRRCILFLL